MLAERIPERNEEVFCTCKMYLYPRFWSCWDFFAQPTGKLALWVLSCTHLLGCEARRFITKDVFALNPDYLLRQGTWRSSLYTTTYVNAFAGFKVASVAGGLGNIRTHQNAYYSTGYNLCSHHDFPASFG